MKKAYEYIRISNEEQSNYSITGQPIFNKQFAERLEIDIEKSYVDDGYSAKDFNRPAWKQLVIDLEKNKNKIEFLIVLKYDRIIRDTLEGLIFIQQLEKWGIKLLSVMENFSIDRHSPYFFKMRVDLLMAAETERREGQRRTRFGIWSAQTQGRFISRAPFGYNNNTVIEGKNKRHFISINEEEAKVVREMFSDFLAEVPAAIILQKARDKGFKLMKHGALKSVITNHLYGGLVKVAAFQDKPETIVPGIHEAIVPTDIFWHAFYKMQDSIRPQLKIVDPSLPLRGFLLCGCGHPLTGSKSKGKYQHYWYYRCLKCNGMNHSANKVHDYIHDLLGCFSLAEELTRAIEIENAFQLKEQLQERENDIKRTQGEYDQARKRLDALEEKHILSQIEPATYHKWYPVYSGDVEEKTKRLSTLKESNDEKHMLYKNTLPYFHNMPELYKGFDIDGKQDLLKGIFPGSLYREKKSYRTPIINDLFIPNLNKINAMLTIENPQNMQISPKCPIGEPNRTFTTESSIVHLLKIVARLVAVLLILFTLSAKGQDTTLQPNPEPCAIDSLAIIKAYFKAHPEFTIGIIQDYLNSTHGWIEQDKISYMGNRAFVKQQGIFLGAGIGIRNYSTHDMVVKNNKYVSVWRPANEIIMYYVSGQWLSGKNMVGLNLGNTTCSFQYSRHLN